MRYHERKRADDEVARLARECAELRWMCMAPDEVYADEIARLTKLKAEMERQCADDDAEGCE